MKRGYYWRKLPLAKYGACGNPGGGLKMQPRGVGVRIEFVSR